MLQLLIRRLCLCGAIYFAMGFTVCAQEPAATPGLPPLPHPEIAQPPQFHHVTPWWWYASGGAAVVSVLSLLFWLLLSEAKPKAAKREQPLDEAQRDLQSLLALCGAMPPEDTGHAVSTILRNYQQRRYGIPAPTRTSEEIFQSRVVGGDETTLANIQRFAPVATFYDWLEFGHLPKSTDDARKLVQESIEALKREPVQTHAPHPPSR